MNIGIFFQIRLDNFCCVVSAAVIDNLKFPIGYSLVNDGIDGICYVFPTVIGGHDHTYKYCHRFIPFRYQSVNLIWRIRPVDCGSLTNFNSSGTLCQEEDTYSSENKHKVSN